jgi:probable HAF family extracellular repeat protein
VPAQYAVTQLGDYGSNAFDLNEAGQVVGDYGSGDVQCHAALWDNGTMIDLGTLGGNYSCAKGINDQGQVVGYAGLPGDTTVHAFLLTPRGGVWFQDSDLDGRNDFMIDLGTLNGWDYSEATDINNAGQVAGVSGPVIGGSTQAFYWDAASGLIGLGTPPGFPSSGVSAINASGQVAGFGQDPVTGHSTTFLWDAVSGMTVMDAGAGFTDSFASGINDAGQLVGNRWNDTTGSTFLWTPSSPNGLTGSFTDLGMLPGATYGGAFDINNAGQVVGSCTVVETVYVCDCYCDDYGCYDNCYYQDYYYPHAVVWDAAGGVQDLGLDYAVAINDAGAIAANGVSDGWGHGYLLSPIPPGTPLVSIADAPAVTEGNAGTTEAVFTVNLSNECSETVTVAYATADAGATAGSDYQATSGTLTFAPGETSKTITVLVNGDRLAESDEMFVVNLSSPTNAVIADGQGFGTILDDEPHISIADQTVTEGNVGSVNAMFTVTLSHAYDEDVIVPYATADGDATAGSDYTAAAGNVVIPAGRKEATLAIAVKGDRVTEPTETFVVNLSAPANAAIDDGQGIGTILDDEPRINIGDATVSEGNTGTRPITFTVSLSAAYDVPVTVSYATANGSATAGSDYQAASGTLTIPAGQTSGTITVEVSGDRLAEPNETFFVNLTNPSYGVISDAQGVGTILDDEPRISISDVTKAEGKKGQTTLFTFTVTLSAAYDQAVTMSFRTTDGTATTGDQDYVAQTGTLTFKPGETAKTITIEVKGDGKKEADEVFYLDQFGLTSNALFTKNRGTGTILNDD